MPAINFTILNKIGFYILCREFTFFIKSIQFNQIGVPGLIYFGDLHKFNNAIIYDYHKIYRTYKKMKSNWNNEIIKLYP